MSSAIYTFRVQLSSNKNNQKPFEIHEYIVYDDGTERYISTYGAYRTFREATVIAENLNSKG